MNTNTTNTDTNDDGNYAAPSRGALEAVRVCFAKYFDFSGRASRSEFWWFFVFVFIFLTAIHLAITIQFTFTNASKFLDTDNLLEFAIASADNFKSTFRVTATVIGVFSYAILFPLLVVGVRRLRDIGISVWWILLVAIGKLWGLLITIASPFVGHEFPYVDWINNITGLINNTDYVMSIVLLVLLCLSGKSQKKSF